MKQVVFKAVRRGLDRRVLRKVTVGETPKKYLSPQMKRFVGGLRNLSSSGRRRPETLEEALRLLDQEREGRIAERERADQERERADQEREGRIAEREGRMAAEDAGHQTVRRSAEAMIYRSGSRVRESLVESRLVGDRGELLLANQRLSRVLEAAHAQLEGEELLNALEMRASMLFNLSSHDRLTSFIMYLTPEDRIANQALYLPNGMNQVTENLVNRTVNYVLQTVVRALGPLFDNLDNRGAVLFLHNNVDRNEGRELYPRWNEQDLRRSGDQNANPSLVGNTNEVATLLNNSGVSNTDGILACRNGSGMLAQGSILQTVEVKKELFGPRDKKVYRAAAQGLGLVLWGGSEELRVRQRQPLYTIITDGNQWQLFSAQLRPQDEWNHLLFLDRPAEFYEVYNVSASETVQFTGDEDSDIRVLQTLMVWLSLTRDVWRAAAEPLDLTRQDPGYIQYVYARPSVHGEFDPSVFGENGRKIDNGGERIDLVLDHKVPGFSFLVYDGCVRGKAATIKFVQKETRWRNEIAALRKLEDLGISEGVPQIVFEGKVGLGCSAMWGDVSLRDSVLATSVRGQAWDRMTSTHSPSQRHWIARWVDDIAKVLDALENAGLVHGDVKPGNIVIADFPPTVQVLNRDSLDGCARLIDWEGLASATSVSEASPGTAASGTKREHRFTWTFASTPTLLDCAQTCLDDWESLGFTVIDRLGIDNEYQAEWEQILDCGFRDPATFDGGAQEYFELLKRRSDLLGLLLQSDEGREVFGGHLDRVAAAHKRGQSLLHSSGEIQQIAYDLVEDEKAIKQLNDFATQVVKQAIDEQKKRKE